MTDCIFALLCASGITRFHHCTFCLSYLVTAPLQAVSRAPYDAQHVVIPYISCPSVCCEFFVKPRSEDYQDICPRCDSQQGQHAVNWEEVPP